MQLMKESARFLVLVPRCGFGTPADDEYLFNLRAGAGSLFIVQHEADRNFLAVGPHFGL